MDIKNMPKIGIALGSGGAAGLAHIGVLKVLKENNIPIDYIAGTSIGSIIGAYFALNQEIESLEKKVSLLTKKDLLKLIDFPSPKRAIISGKKITKFLDGLIEGRSFSDTKVPLRIIATDMCTGEEVQLKKGKIIDAIRASISLPGIFPPAIIDGRLFLDGGIVNPTPVDAVKNMGADIIIGVDLTIKHHVEIKNPTIVDTLMRSYEIIRNHTTKHNIEKVSSNIIIIQTQKKQIRDKYRFYDSSLIIEGGKAAKSAMPKIKSLINNFNRS